VSSLTTVNRFARKLPPSRTKVRIGRALTLVATALGADPISVATLNDGSVLRFDLRDRTQAGAFWNGDYESDYLDVLEKLVHVAGGVVYDIGANVGLVAIPLARRLGDGGTVICFEPVFENFARLQQNASLNHLDAHRLSVYQVALGSADATADIATEADYGASTGNAVLLTAGWERPARSTRVTTIHMRRLDGLIEEEHLPLPNIIKLDVEGSEVGVLAGARHALDLARPIILGEFNSNLMPRFGHSFIEAARLLPEDYRIFSFASADLLVERTPFSGLGDVLLVPRERIAGLPFAIAA
jgi:FkbM family methyltransferase